VKEISLTKGFVALVDDEDYEWLSCYNWCAAVTKNNVYAKRNLKGILMHREILKYHGYDIHFVDHFDHNGLNNQKSNLRPATSHQNSGNMRKTRGSSQYKGVHLESFTKMWRASISMNGKVLKSPRFDLEIDAAKWYDVKAKEYFGDFALVNNV
jgi:hypothetical protein